MARFDYTYYRDNFGGKASEDEFDRYVGAAFDVVSLLIGMDAEDSSDSAVLRALGAQVDHLIAHSDAIRGITKESLGDYSVSYGKGDLPYVSSLPVSPEVIAALTRAGLLTRWA